MKFKMENLDNDDMNTFQKAVSRQEQRKLSAEHKLPE